MSDPGLYERLALRRINDGGIAKSAGVYLDQGRPTPAYLTDVFDQLTWTGLVIVADGDGIWDLRRVSLTDAGQARYAELREREAAEQLRSPVPDPQFGPQIPAGRRSSGPHPAGGPSCLTGPTSP